MKPIHYITSRLTIYNTSILCFNFLILTCMALTKQWSISLLRQNFENYAFLCIVQWFWTSQNMTEVVPVAWLWGWIVAEAHLIITHNIIKHWERLHAVQHFWFHEIRKAPQSWNDRRWFWNKKNIYSIYSNDDDDSNGMKEIILNISTLPLPSRKFPVIIIHSNFMKIIIFAIFWTN